MMQFFWLQINCSSILIKMYKLQVLEGENIFLQSHMLVC